MTDRHLQEHQTELLRQINSNLSWLNNIIATALLLGLGYLVIKLFS
ncbi:hypothetical protein [Aquiflexum gelatinilyticum]|nr:hypothetical protein [Aquiflexum gelatinilyticum]MCS4435215.1 hypothetical protein [Aquiflexum gelatinilyticum]